MSVDVNVPSLGESINEVQVSGWLKQPGETVAMDEPLIELESDKATVEVPAPAAGVVQEIVADVGAVLQIGDLLARIDTEAQASPTKDEATPAKDEAAPAKDEEAPAKEEAAPAKDEAPEPPAGQDKEQDKDQEKIVMPAAQRVMSERGLTADDVSGSGPGGRVLKEDAQQAAPSAPSSDQRSERTVPMSPLRRKIAERLVEAQHNAALLTTFNEIDMTKVKALRAEHQEAFQERYGVKLGFMSFFVKAAVSALQLVPNLNARIEDQNFIFHDYCDIGIAVGGGKGLVVPVIRNADLRDFGELEQVIGDFGARAKANKLELEELQGGTFTISNGGVYGSLLSTPIINPPQSGVLGLHAIEDRPVVIDGQIVIRPMMYVALSYDHRTVDGREAVTFLKHIKHCVEQPERLLLKV